MAARTSPTDPAELDALIAATESRLLERQARVRRRVDALEARARSAVTPQRLAVPAVAALLLWGLWRAVRPSPRHHLPRVATRPRPRLGGAFWLTQTAAVVWPLLTPAWRARMSPAAIGGVLAAAWQRERSDARARGGAARPQPVPAVDLRRYAGTWYEVARYRNRFEDACTGQPSATYRPRGDLVEIVNRCPERGGERTAHGVAREVPGSRGARLQVSFAPRWLRAVPFVWADYWILHLESDYSAALVGTPDRRRLWLLARERALPQAVMLRLLDAADAQGFDLHKLILSHPAHRTVPRPAAAAPAAGGAASARPLDSP